MILFIILFGVNLEGRPRRVCMVEGTPDNGWWHRECLKALSVSGAVKAIAVAEVMFQGWILSKRRELSARKGSRAMDRFWTITITRSRQWYRYVGFLL